MENLEPQKINSHNEWDKLKEIIVGRAEGTTATMTWRNQEPIPEQVMSEARAIAKEASPQWFYDEVAEDLEELCKTIRSFGVKVHRPEVFDYTKMYSFCYN